MTRLYSQRMLNPFHGIVNVAEIEGADAVYRDGTNWTLYIQGTSESAELGDGTQAEISVPDIKFGTWTAGQAARHSFSVDGNVAVVEGDTAAVRLTHLVNGAVGPGPTAQWFQVGSCRASCFSNCRCVKSGAGTRTETC